MASEEELQTLATWFEKEGFAIKRYREVTISYLTLVFGNCTAAQLKLVCQTARRLALEHDHSQRHKKLWDRTKLRVSWLALRSEALEGAKAPQTQPRNGGHLPRRGGDSRQSSLL